MAKKKLKEFTIKEIERVCSARDKNCYYVNLSNECPFILACHYAMDTLPVTELEREIEITVELFGNSEQLEQHNGLTDISNREKGEKLD